MLKVLKTIEDQSKFGLLYQIVSDANAEISTDNEKEYLLTWQEMGQWYNNNYWEVILPLPLSPVLPQVIPASPS
jgi:hypothetical protein